MISYEELGAIVFLIFSAVAAVWKQNKIIQATNSNGKKEIDEKIAALIVEKDTLKQDVTLLESKFRAASEALNKSNIEKQTFERKADDLAKQVARLEESLETTKRDADNLRKSLDELRGMLDKIQADNLNLLKANKDLNERLDVAENRADELAKQLEQSRENERVAVALAELREARLEEARAHNAAIWQHAKITIVANPETAKLFQAGESIETLPTQEAAQ